MKAISRGGLLLAPHVTDMRNGLFRPEVAYSKGKGSGILFGELHNSPIRCAIIAEQAAVAAMMTYTNQVGMWDECARALDNCQRMAEMLLGVV